MSEFPWNQFGVLLAGGLLGVLAGTPFGLALNRERLASAPISTRGVLLLSVLQNGLLIVIATGAGLLISNQIALGAPLLEGAFAGEGVLPSLLDRIPLAIGFGVAAAGIILALENSVFRSNIPQAVRRRPGSVALWKRFLVGFHGGINEEILMRLFLFSLLAWLLGQIWRTADHLPTVGVFWSANIGAALAFGLSHLPATAALAPLTRSVVARALLLNGIGGIVFGYLYWHSGLIAAMLAHFSADMVVLIIGPQIIESSHNQLPASR